MLSCEYLVSVRLISVEECFMVKCVRDSVFSRVLAPSYRIRHRSHVGGDGQAEPHRCRSCRLLRLFGGGFGQKEEVHLVRFLEGALEPRPHFALPPARCKSVLESLRDALVFPLEMLEMFHLCVYGGRGCQCRGVGRREGGGGKLWSQLPLSLLCFCRVFILPFLNSNEAHSTIRSHLYESHLPFSREIRSVDAPRSSTA